MSVQLRSVFRVSNVNRWILVTLCLCGLTVGNARAQQQLTAEVLLKPFIENYGPKYADVELAIEALRAQKVDECRQHLQTAYQKNPDLPPPHIIMAQILFRAQQLQAGRAELEQAAEKNPNDPGAFVYLGQFGLQERRIPEAESMYKKGLELLQGYNSNPKRKKRLLSNAYDGLALIEEQKQNWPEALTLLERLLQNDPENLLALTRKGRVQYKIANGDQEGEKAAFSTFIKLNQIDPEKTARPEINMAILYQNDGRADRAEALMNMAARKDPENIRTRMAVAKWALEAGKMPMAKQNAAAAAKVDSNALDVRLFQGLIHRIEGNDTAAIQAFRNAHYQSPVHLGAMTQLAILLAEGTEEQKQQAVGFAQLAVASYRDIKQTTGREAMSVYAWTLHRFGRSNQARRAVAQIINSKGAISPDSAYYLAQILFDVKDPVNAKKVVAQALQSQKFFVNRSKAQALLQTIGDV